MTKRLLRHKLFLNARRLNSLDIWPCAVLRVRALPRLRGLPSVLVIGRAVHVAQFFVVCSYQILIAGVW